MLSSQQAEGATVWTCAMHPQIKMPEPGKCPICFMDLIPLKDTKPPEHPRELRMSQDAVALANIRTVPVMRQTVENTVRLVGKVDYDETEFAYITAWVPGRIDELYVDFTGTRVEPKMHMAKLYSPKLAVAQEALIQALKLLEESRDDRDEFLKKNVKAAEDRLRLLGVQQELIDAIKNAKPADRKVRDHVTIYARKKGVVIQRHVTKGMYVKTGDRIYTIADLSKLWIHLDAYETDLPWLRYGQKVEVTTDAYSNEGFEGRITFISPVLDEKTRTVKVRVNVVLARDDVEKLKPGMFVQARVKSRLYSGGRVVDPSFANKWISPMHPEIVKDKPGFCDKCGMKLVKAEELGYITDPNAGQRALVIPDSAPLITGKRAIVYVRHRVEKDKDTGEVEYIFRGRPVLLGPRAGNYYIVRHGLEEGEEVVVAGNFKIDADLQIKGQLSMMNPTGGSSGGGHAHHHGSHAGHNMPSTPAKTKTPVDVPPEFRPELTPVYSVYLSVMQSLARDDLNTARRDLERLIETAAKVDRSSLKGKTREQLREIFDRIVFASEAARTARSRPEVRKHFSDLSAAVIDLADQFGHVMKGSLHRFETIAEKNSKPQPWLQATPNPQSPYLKSGRPVGSPIASSAPITATPQFLASLRPLYSQYFSLQMAMSQKGHPKAASHAMGLQNALRRVETGSLDGFGKAAWKHYREQLTKLNLPNWSRWNVEQQRIQFQKLSAIMLEVVERFGHSEQTTFYKAFCPMAFKNKGAFWLQPQKEIVNPYFSGGMRGCGEATRDFQPVRLTVPNRKEATP
ncbi:MAG: hypothetical protein Tsb009_24410 [Planctomycetaceae bacterium]